MKSGIYIITAPSGSQYVGSAVDLGNRRRVHFHLLRQRRHFNRGLQRACAKYGIDRLSFSVLLLCRREDLIFFEQRAIDILKPRYNACPTAGSQLGRKQSPDTVAKVKAAKSGKKYPRTVEGQASFSALMKGHPFWGPRQHSSEVKRKVSAAGKGKKHADGFEHNLTVIQRAKIVSAYLAGTGQLALAAQWKTSHKVIRRVLVDAGVQISPSGHSIKLAA